MAKRRTERNFICGVPDLNQFLKGFEPDENAWATNSEFCSSMGYVIKNGELYIVSHRNGVFGGIRVERLKDFIEELTGIAEVAEFRQCARIKGA